jgi:heme exporter protein B
MAVSAFLYLLRFELKRAFIRRGSILQLLLYFVLLVSIFPFGVGTDRALISNIAIGIIWVAAMLVCLQSFVILFEEDYEQGMLEQLILMPYPFPAVVAVKMLVHWLSSGVAIALFSPVLLLVMGVELSKAIYLMASLGFGTISITVLGAFGAALTLGLKRAGVLLTLLVLPLNIPVVIFAVQAASKQGSFEGLLGLLFLLLILIPLSLIATSSLLKMAVSDR